MSLINDMLKDLEARGGAEKVTGDVRSTPAAPVRSANRGLLFVLGALVILLAGAVAWLMVSEPEEPVLAAPVTTTPSVASQMNSSLTDSEEAAKSVQPAEPVPVVAEKEHDAAPVLPVPVEESTPTTEAPPVVSEPATVAVVDESSVNESRTQDTTEMIVRRHEPTAAEKAARASREGFAALRRNDWDLAARMLGELVLLEPANDDAREGLVIALANQGRLAEVDGVLLDGLAVGVEPARFAKLRARLLASRGEVAEALQSLAVAVPAVTEDPEFHAMRGALAQQAGDYALALQTYRKLVAFAPGNGTWQAGLAMALDQTGDSAQALEAYRRAYAAGDLEPALADHVRARLDTLSDRNESNEEM
ncbi:MAG TPA: tetratricopeptide repeat protein [Gammaproteobacteria bacterium]